MNVGNYSQSTINIFNARQTTRNNESKINLEDEDRRNRDTAFKRDDLVSQFWNMTDSMPRANQVDFAASIVANRIMKQGITDENKSFLQNISNRFSPEEIGNLKTKVLNHPSVKNQNSGDVETFLQDFDKFISSQEGGNGATTRKQQVSPRLRNPDEIFFQTTLKHEATTRPTIDLYRVAAAV